MDFSSGYIPVPKTVQDSLIQTNERVRLLGSINITDFETEFKDKLSEGTLNTEKAILLGLKNPSSSLPKIADILKDKAASLY